MLFPDRPGEKRKVLSASRRTDIPAFYLEWFMAGIKRGAFDVVNPYSRKVTTVDARPSLVHSIVFWSKNFGPFLSANDGQRLTGAGYHLFFNFTVNSPSPLLEPNLPPLSERRRQMEILAGRFGAESVDWRFDPICHFSDSAAPHKPPQNNLAGFAEIAQRAAALGVRRCVTSFYDDYAKVRRRVRRGTSLGFSDPPLARKIAILNRMESFLGKIGVTLYTCCEKTLMDNLPATCSIQKSACIPHDILVELFGGALPGTADRGQRRQLGCGCRISRDIGSYRHQPCRHNCLYCYASPAP